MTQPDWPARQVRLIADEVKRHRMARDMSAADLAAKTAEIGHPITRSALANLESGRRGIVTTADLLVLAAALDVTPLALLFPAGYVDEVEVLPGVERPTWSAVEWFTAEEGIAAEKITESLSDPIRRFREHARYVRAWQNFRFEWSNLNRLLSDSSADQRELLREHMDDLKRSIRDQENALSSVRLALRHLGLRLPPLPADLAHIDQSDADDGEVGVR